MLRNIALSLVLMVCFITRAIAGTSETSSEQTHYKKEASGSVVSVLVAENSSGSHPIAIQNSKHALYSNGIPQTQKGVFSFNKAITSQREALTLQDRLAENERYLSFKNKSPDHFSRSYLACRDHSGIEAIHAASAIARSTSSGSLYLSQYGTPDDT